MLNKKSSKSEQSDEELALQQRVDDMMAADKPDPTPTVAISADKPNPQKTAPTLPAKPTKEKSAEPPVVIKLAAETERQQVETNKQEEQDKPQEPEAPELSPVPPANEPANETELDNNETDKAVDDIMAAESDRLLAVDDAITTRKQNLVKPKRSSWKAKLKGLPRNKWAWLLLATVLVIVLALPQTRYKVLGLIIKKPVTITVLDSVNTTPVSGTEVSLAGQLVKTDANGKAKLKVSIGKQTLTVQKKYYQAYEKLYFVGLKSPAQTVSVKLKATGRLVPITVRNKITGKPLSGAVVSILGTSAKTNSKGETLVALPTTKSSNAAKISLVGYNAATVEVQVTDSVVKANTFELTPTGRIYFLSNLGGNIDVVKTNIDGTGRKTVLQGTGREDSNTTSLLASRDWRYLVLKARRDSAQPALYMIDTATDKVTQFDSGDAGYSLLGWYGHSFLYDVTRNALSNWQPGRQVLKSYDAAHLQLNQLDQNQAEGSKDAYVYQNFYNYYILNGTVAYNTQWYSFGFGNDLSSKTDTIRAVQLTGNSKKDYQSFPTGVNGYIQASLYEPEGVYYAVYNNTDNKITYYKYENQSVKTETIDANTFGKTYPTFLISPVGKQTFWTELRDGKNTLFVGNANAGAKKQIASPGDYSPYGWYSENYTLVSKASSQLYIMPSAGLEAGRQPLKITDYYKPAQTYNGYGYGYGGL